ncbi:tyrosine-type recombinase/integrase [Macrococcoides canis]|uniref:tyrosine-type recombinase/integrase n=1 Tax=Macrococcoides canis TaxID=1855823 RepID=UPI00140DCB49|nr:tyrosine-type recombinase/integrase [Macrococcus canis]MEE1107190.1 tyrosine-type recombinase/integrase [Macrococcus canis]
MNKSNPIIQISDIEKFKSYFEHHERDWLLFSIGINIPVKTNTLLSLKPSELNHEENLYYFIVNNHTIYLSEEISDRLRAYIVEHAISDDEYIFKSTKTKRVLTRQQFHRILTDAKKNVHYSGVLGSQALKKTFAYQAYVQGVDIRQIQQICGHHTKAETYKFIDVNYEDARFIQLNL